MRSGERGVKFRGDGREDFCLDNSGPLVLCYEIGLGVVPGRRLALGCPGAFRFLGEDFEAPAVSLSCLRVPVEFLLNDVPGPVGLCRVHHMPAYGPRGQVGQLESGRVDLLVGEDDFEAQHRPLIVCVIDGCGERQVQARRLLACPSVRPQHG